MIATVRHALTLSAVALLCGAAFAQAGSEKKQPLASQNWSKVVQQMERNGVTLEKAISDATEKVGGNAISARVLTYASDPRRSEPGSTSQYRIEVLCRTDAGKFKVVTFNGVDGRLLSVGNASQSAACQSAQGNASTMWKNDKWQMGNDDFVVFRLIKCSDLTGTKIKNYADEDLGHVADFAIDPRNGLVSYAALSFGGWIEMGDKLFAVPLESLSISNADQIVLDLSKAELKNAEGFDQDDWPVHANQRWAADLRMNAKSDYELIAAEEEARSTQRDRAEKITSIQKASALIGMKVKNRQGEELGSISDLYIDPDRARVAYAMMSHGGWLGIGDKLFAVPWQSFQAGPEDALLLDISKKRLENAPGASKADQESWNDPDLLIRVYEFYEVEPYWGLGRHVGSGM